MAGRNQTRKGKGRGGNYVRTGRQSFIDAYENPAASRPAPAGPISAAAQRQPTPGPATAQFQRNFNTGHKWGVRSRNAALVAAPVGIGVLGWRAHQRNKAKAAKEAVGKRYYRSADDVLRDWYVMG